MIRFRSILALPVVITLLVYSGCSDTVVTPPAPDVNQIRGTVTFVDTNFVPSGGSYLIAAYSSWPPTGGPTAFDTIKITSTGGAVNKSYNYTLVGLNTGDYVVSVGYRKNTPGQSPIMSVYGCDTARAQNSGCWLNPPLKATIGASNQSAININMLSWADTTNKIF